jgi:hypothetical protein
MRRARKDPGHRIALKNPERDNFEEFIRENAKVCERVAVYGAGVGKSLALCGAGPSLADEAARYVDVVDEVWGCNSAATWLYETRHRVTHALTVEQTEQMIDEWAAAPPIEYLLASSVHPDLVRHLLDHGRKITFFHNYIGVRGPHMGNVSYEQWLYNRLYPETVRVGSALNAVTRAIDLACYMGFRPIYVLGADCALKVLKPAPDVPFGSDEHTRWLEEDVVMHADGSSALRSGASAVTMHGEIDGRHWESKADLWVTAIWLVQMARAIEGLELVGDTLPNALIDKPDSYLDDMPHLTRPDGTQLDFDIEDQGAYYQHG